MNSKSFETTLRQALHRSVIPAERKPYEDTLMLAGNLAMQIPLRKRISFPQFLAAQIRFIGWKIWGVQALFLSALTASLSRLYQGEQPRHIACLLFCLSVLVLMTALPFLYRSVRYRMQEVESAARFSLVKLLAARLVIIGVGDLFLFGAIFLTALRGTSLSAEGIFISLCFPFLLAGSGCLFMLGHLSARNFFAGSMGLCFLLILLAALAFRQYEALLPYAFSGRWILVCAPLLLICIRQFRYLLCDSAYAEMQLT